MDDYGDVQIQLEPGGEWHRPNRVSPYLTACGKYIVGTVAKRDRDVLRANHQCKICWPPHPMVECRFCKYRMRAEFAHDECPRCGSLDSLMETATTKMRKLIREHETETGDLYYDDEEPTNPDFWGKEET